MFLFFFKHKTSVIDGFVQYSVLVDLFEIAKSHTSPCVCARPSSRSCSSSISSFECDVESEK